MNKIEKIIITTIFVLVLNVAFLQCADAEKAKKKHPVNPNANPAEYDENEDPYNDPEPSVTGAYGYKISIVKYNGSGEPTRVGKPILIYHPAMMGTVHTERGSLDGGTQFSLSAVDGDATAAGTWEGEGYPSDPSDVGWNNGIFPEGGNQGRYEFITEGWDCPPGPLKEDPNCSKTGFFVFIFRFNTSKRLVTYDTAHMSYDDDYYATHADSRLTEYNVKHNAYLDDVKNQWAGNRALIERNFNIRLNDMDMDKYFIQVEVVQRVLYDDFEDYATYLAAVNEVVTTP